MYLEGRTCLICGSLIGDNNSTGIGGECRYSYNKATRIVFLEDAQRKKEYYRFISSQILTLFISEFQKTKFRSEFKKSFFTSMKEIRENGDNLSIRQQEICKNMLLEKIPYDFMLELDKKDERYKIETLSRFKPNAQEKDKIINLANKFRHEFRAIKKKD